MLPTAIKIRFEVMFPELEYARDYLPLLSVSNFSRDCIRNDNCALVNKLTNFDKSSQQHIFSQSHNNLFDSVVHGSECESSSKFRPSAAANLNESVLAEVVNDYECLVVNRIRGATKIDYNMDTYFDKESDPILLPEETLESVCSVMVESSTQSDTSAVVTAILIHHNKSVTQPFRNVGNDEDDNEIDCLVDNSPSPRILLATDNEEMMVGQFSVNNNTSNKIQPQFIHPINYGRDYEEPETIHVSLWRYANHVPLLDRYDDALSCVSTSCLKRVDWPEYGCKLTYDECSSGITTAASWVTQAMRTERTFIKPCHSNGLNCKLSQSQPQSQIQPPTRVPSQFSTDLSHQRTTQFALAYTQCSSKKSLSKSTSKSQPHLQIHSQPLAQAQSTLKQNAPDTESNSRISNVRRRNKTNNNDLIYIPSWRLQSLHKGMSSIFVGIIIYVFLVYFCR